MLRGDFSPRYLWVTRSAIAAHRLVQPQAPIVVVLRDPIERYASHMRLAAERRQTRPAPMWREEIASGLALLGGFYDDLLRPWDELFGRDRIILLTLDQLRSNPQLVCERIWDRLGVSTDFVVSPASARRNAAKQMGDNALSEPLIAQLASIYAPHVARLHTEWDVDVSSWSTAETPS